MAKQTNQYKIQVALPVDSPFANARVNTFVDNLNALPHNVGDDSGTPFTYTEPNVSLLHTVKEVTEIQLPSVTKDNYEITDINNDGGIRKYNGGLVDGGEFSFTTESYIEPIQSLFNTGNETYSASLHGKDYTTDYPFQGIDINGNPMSQGYGGGTETSFPSNTGWAIDVGSGLDIHGQNANPTTKRYFQFTPQGSTSSDADTTPPTVLQQSTDSVYKASMADKIYTIGYKNFYTSDSSPFSATLSKSGHITNNVISDLPLAHNVDQTVTLRMQRSPLTMSVTATGTFTELALSDFYMLRMYTWEDMLLENTKVFFKVSDGSTDNMLFESIITNVETNTPIDGTITKTITAKLTGGITHG